MRNRDELRRSITLLLRHGLIVYQAEFREYVLDRKVVYSRCDLELRALEDHRNVWKQIKEEHEFLRSFGTKP